MLRTAIATLALTTILPCTACGGTNSPYQETKSGLSADAARGQSPSARPDWLPDDIPLPADLVIFETARAKLPTDAAPSWSLKGYTWASTDAAAVTLGLRERLMAAGYKHEGNPPEVTPQLIQFSGKTLAPGTTAFMMLDPAGDHLVLSLSLVRAE
jgi:hypothetical protein